MTVRKTLRRFLSALIFVSVSGSAAAFSYGILAAGVLAAAIAVVAAPAVGIVLTAEGVTAIMASATVHSALAAYIFDQPVKTSSSTPAPVQKVIADPSAQTITVNLAPMTPAQSSKYQASKTAAKAAAAVTPVPAQPPTGQAAAQAQAQGVIASTLSYAQGYCSKNGCTISNTCSDNNISTVTCYVHCSDGGSGMCNGLSYNGYVYTGTGTYAPAKAAVTCPAGSFQNGSVCTVNKDPTQDSLVNDGSATPQWNLAAIPSDATLSADGSTLSRTAANADGTTTTTVVTAQSDGSLNVVDSTYNPATNQTVHDGYAVDTNGVVQGVGAAVSTGNYAGSPAPGTTYPNGGNPNGSNKPGTGSGGDGGCGSTDHPNCNIDFGTPDAGPSVPTADSTDSDAAMKTTVFDQVTKFQLPQHTSVCPTMDVPLDYFGKSGSTSTTQPACSFVENNRTAMSSVFLLIWAIAALMIVLSA